MRAGLQFILAIDHDLLTGGQAGFDHRLAIFCWPDLHRLHPDGFVRFDHVGIGALRPALHDAGRHDGRVLSGREDESRINKFSRPQFQILVRESGLQLHRAGRLIDLVVDHCERSLADRGGITAIECRHREDRSSRRLRSAISANPAPARENDRDRFELRNHNDSARIRGVDNVADIDQPKSRAPIDRRLDLGVIKLGLRALDRGLIGLHGRGELPGLSFRRVEVLSIDHLFLQQVGIARERRLRVCELGLVLSFFANCLIKRFLKWARIDLSQQVAGFDVLTFLEEHLLQFPINARVDGHRVERLHRSEPLEINRHILLLDLAGDHRDRAACRSTTVFAAVRLSWLHRAAAMAGPPGPDKQQASYGNENCSF